MTGTELSTKFSPAKNRAEAKSIDVSSPALEYAARLIYQVCCFAGSFNLIEEFHDQQLCAAIERHDSAVFFDRLTVAFSFQGISNEVASSYMRRHGRATWRAVRKSLAEQPTCSKLKTYWHFHDCRFERTKFICAAPDHIKTCPLPKHRLRNGHLNQIAYSLFLFIRDIADGDLIGWIDNRLDRSNDEAVRNALIEPLRNVYGVSDKVLAIGLSSILIGAADVRPRWLEVGVQLIAIDTLVHNFLHRTGILRQFKASHAYGPDCYRPGGCAAIIRSVADRVDARVFNRAFPRNFPRFVQLAIWSYCGQEAFNICNGNRIDDRNRCQNRYCRLHASCGRIRLK
jgi:hypothetical protein